MEAAPRDLRTRSGGPQNQASGHRLSVSVLCHRPWPATPSPATGGRTSVSGSEPHACRSVKARLPRAPTGSPSAGAEAADRRPGVLQGLWFRVRESLGRETPGLSWQTGANGREAASAVLPPPNPSAGPRPSPSARSSDLALWSARIESLRRFPAAPTGWAGRRPVWGRGPRPEPVARGPSHSPRPRSSAGGSRTQKPSAFALAVAAVGR